ncbi:hypothetical protein G6F62_015870 [Rhizopus arrhizus]|nr:hypothetical protein G6F62_015870 [Rhizopus arrhizus]
MERSAPGVSLTDSPYGKGTITDADIARAQQIATGYGFDAGSLNPPANKTEVEDSSRTSSASRRSATARSR